MLYALGQALEDRGLLDEAAESYGRVASLRPALAEPLSDLGRVQLALGRTAQAIASCRRALAIRPRFAEALGNLANAERANGSLASAIDGYRRVLELEPKLAEAHHNLGSALLEAGDAAAALACFRNAAELRPDYASAVTQLARLLSAERRGAEAVPYYERLLARAPSASALHEFGDLLAGLGRFAPAADAFLGALARAPGDARLHANLAHVLNCLGQFSPAIEHGQRAVALDPRLPEAHLHLGNALLAINEVHGAEAAYRAGLAVAPEHAPLHTAIAMAQRSLGLLDAAEQSTRRALELRPGAADALALLGSLAIDRGQFGDAERLLREALAVDAALPEALIGLSAARKQTVADAWWADSARTVLERGLPVAHAINLHHALGKYHEDIGEYAPAFHHHRAGSELARRSRPRYDRAAMSARVTRTLADFDRTALASLAASGNASERHVFVVGMPRSGTTLVEQILASHPQVHGAGEVLYWNFAADLEAAAPAAERVATIAALARDYVDSLGRRAPEAARIVDKLPSNFKHLGLIHAALPRARIIYLERSPLDTCLSIYFQGFSAAHPYATDFGDLAHYYGEFRRLMAHWRATLGSETLLGVRYEALVEEPELWSRRIVEHVGLAWDPRCLEFHRTERVVMTASAWQVRQPIGKGSIGRWRRYEPYLAALRAALGEDETSASPAAGSTSVPVR